MLQNLIKFLGEFNKGACISNLVASLVVLMKPLELVPKISIPLNIPLSAPNKVEELTFNEISLSIIKVSVEATYVAVPLILIILLPSPILIVFPKIFKVGDIALILFVLISVGAFVYFQKERLISDIT